MDTETETPITPAMIAKWGSMAFAALTVIVSLTWKAASLQSQVDLLRQDNVTLRKELEGRQDNVDKRLAAYDIRLAAQDKSINEVQNTLSKVLVIVERMDKKLGSP